MIVLIKGHFISWSDRTKYFPLVWANYSKHRPTEPHELILDTDSPNWNFYYNPGTGKSHTRLKPQPFYCPYHLATTGHVTFLQENVVCAFKNKTKKQLLVFSVSVQRGNVPLFKWSVYSIEINVWVDVVLNYWRTLIRGMLQTDNYI